MTFNPIIEVSDLKDKIKTPEWVIIDCRFSFQDTDKGRNDYLEAHIPGALYAHLDEDLSGTIIPGTTGRHPIPTIESATQRVSSWGISPNTYVVAYDDEGGALAASRLWWILRWLGHERVVVLNGGWREWIAHNLPVHTGLEKNPTSEFKPQQRQDLIVSSSEVEAIIDNPHFKIIDARTSDRYSGRNETIDPIAGHILNAINAPYSDNLKSNGKFRSAEELRYYFDILLDGIPPQNVIHYCGSGVTAAMNIVGMSYAGLMGSRLYAGSWSEWITDSRREISPTL